MATSPFRYPDHRHVRSPDPGPFLDYQTYKPHLQQEFRRRCVYCQVPDTFKGYEAFSVEHYYPKSGFPHLRSQWSNLLYACNVCNSRKGEFISTPERFVLNPCDHQMSEHLQFDGVAVDIRTQHGRFLAELLDLEGRDRLTLRAFILRNVRANQRARQQILDALAACADRANSLLLQDERLALEAEVRGLRQDLAEVEQDLEFLTGESANDRQTTETG